MSIGPLTRRDELTNPSENLAKPGQKRRKLARAALIVFFLLCAWFAFGISGADEGAYRAFDDSALRWQINPEFRAVAFDYCRCGSRAMHTRPLFIPAKKFIIAIRSIPGLPNSIAVNPTSRQHYENFSRGPLTAYIHLCGEQQMDQFIGIFESIGQRPHLSDKDYRELLDSFHMDFPVAHDAGAIQSTGSVLRDSDAYHAFSIRQNIGPLLLPHIAALSQSLGLPASPQDQTPDQQQAVLDRLDGYVKDHDPELWRTKQLNDYCGGVWAQVFAPPYRYVLVPIVIIRNIAQALLVIMLLLAFWRARRALKRAADLRISGSAAPSPDAPTRR